MLIEIKTHQQQMSLGAGPLHVGRSRKTSFEEEGGIHGIPVTGHHQNGTVTPKQPVEHLPTRDSSGRVREKLKYGKKCQKWLLKQARKCMCHCVGQLQRRPIASARGHG